MNINDRSVKKSVSAGINLNNQREVNVFAKGSILTPGQINSNFESILNNVNQITKTLGGVENRLKKSMLTVQQIEGAVLKNTTTTKPVFELLTLRRQLTNEPGEHRYVGNFIVSGLGINSGQQEVVNILINADSSVKGDVFLLPESNIQVSCSGTANLKWFYKFEELDGEEQYTLYATIKSDEQEIDTQSMIVITPQESFPNIQVVLNGVNEGIFKVNWEQWSSFGNIVEIETIELEFETLSILVNEIVELTIDLLVANGVENRLINDKPGDTTMYSTEGIKGVSIGLTKSANVDYIEGEKLTSEFLNQSPELSIRKQDGRWLKYTDDNIRYDIGNGEQLIDYSSNFYIVYNVLQSDIDFTEVIVVGRQDSSTGIVKTIRYNLVDESIIDSEVYAYLTGLGEVYSAIEINENSDNNTLLLFDKDYNAVKKRYIIGEEPIYTTIDLQLISSNTDFLNETLHEVIDRELFQIHGNMEFEESNPNIYIVNTAAVSRDVVSARYWKKYLKVNIIDSIGNANTGPITATNLMFDGFEEDEYDATSDPGYLADVILSIGHIDIAPTGGKIVHMYNTYATNKDNRNVFLKIYTRSSTPEINSRRKYFKKYELNGTGLINISDEYKLGNKSNVFIIQNGNPLDPKMWWKTGRSVLSYSDKIDLTDWYEYDLTWLPIQEVSGFPVYIQDIKILPTESNSFKILIVTYDFDSNVEVTYEQEIILSKVGMNLLGNRVTNVNSERQRDNIANKEMLDTFTQYTTTSFVEKEQIVYINEGSSSILNLLELDLENNISDSYNWTLHTTSSRTGFSDGGQTYISDMSIGDMSREIKSHNDIVDQGRNLVQILLNDIDKKTVVEIGNGKGKEAIALQYNNDRTKDIKLYNYSLTTGQSNLPFVATIDEHIVTRFYITDIFETNVDLSVVITILEAADTNSKANSQLIADIFTGELRSSEIEFDGDIEPIKGSWNIMFDKTYSVFTVSDVEWIVDNRLVVNTNGFEINNLTLMGGIPYAERNILLKEDVDKRVERDKLAIAFLNLFYALD